VRVAVSTAEVVLSVRDDGVGPNDEPSGGNGLREMASRAEALGGSFTIEPNQPLGTTVRWSVPR
jgi:signal transduction histidine kinase